MRPSGTEDVVRVRCGVGLSWQDDRCLSSLDSKLRLVACSAPGSGCGQLGRSRHWPIARQLPGGLLHCPSLDLHPLHTHFSTTALRWIRFLVVQVYAEASTQKAADELALLTAQAAWTHAGGIGDLPTSTAF